MFCPLCGRLRDSLAELVGRSSCDRNVSEDIRRALTHVIPGVDDERKIDRPGVLQM